MKPFDDMLPEEQEAQNQELITMLDQAYQQSLARTAHVQAEVIQRVGQRLAMLAANTTLSEETPHKQTNRQPTLVQEPGSFRERPRRNKRIFYLLNTIAAVLVVGLLIGGSCVLFMNRLQSTAAKPAVLLMPTQVISSVHVEANGVEMSMSVTPGPYFLGELLEANLVLTNHTSQIVMLGGVINPGGPCSSQALFVQADGERQQYTMFPIPLQFVLSCGAVSDYTITGGSTTVVAGQTIASRVYEPLTHSGDVTLVGEATFYTPAKDSQGIAVWHRSSGPLAGHLPTLHIPVMPKAPTNRTLAFHQQGSTVVVDAPLGTHLLDQTYIICKDSGNNFRPDGIEYAGWGHVPANVLHRPECPQSGSTVVLWKYALGAVGYEIVQGQQG